MDQERMLTRIDEIRACVIRELVSAGVPVGKESDSPCRAVPGQRLASFFDHTLLKPEAMKEEYERLFQEAILWKVWSVCVPPNRVKMAVERLKGSGVKTCTVIGFPFGYQAEACKAEETRIALESGCDEFDMVIPVGMLREGNLPAVFADIRGVVQAARGRLVKVILEVSLLTEEEKIVGGILAILAGANMLKTSTGYSTGGATKEDVSLLRAIAGKSHGVKASGGIRDLATALSMIEAGADRIGASSTALILSEAEKRRKEP